MSISGSIKNAAAPELAAILLTRLGFLWLLVLASLLMGGGTAFYAFMGIAFVITIPYSLWLRSRLKTAQFAPLQFLVDLVLVTGLVYFTGGADSRLTLLYPLVILSAGLVGTPRQALEISVLAVFVYTLLIVLMTNHWIIPYAPDSLWIHQSKASGLTPLLNALSFLLFGLASIYISKRCCDTNTHQKELAETTEALLAAIPSPALLLDQEGCILFANQACCALLGTGFNQLAAVPFTDLQSEGPRAIPEHFGPAAYLKRTGSAPLPAAYQSNSLQVPETALLGPNGRPDAVMPVTFITLTDLRQALETESQLHRVERITAATQIAGELAHEIRTPLTAIAASVELLREYEDRTTAADWLPNSPNRNDRRELFNHIESASSRMNTVIGNFISFAEFSPKDLLSIIKLDSAEENQG